MGRTTSAVLCARSPHSFLVLPSQHRRCTSRLCQLTKRGGEHYPSLRSQIRPSKSHSLKSRCTKKEALKLRATSCQPTAQKTELEPSLNFMGRHLQSWSLWQGPPTLFGRRSDDLCPEQITQNAFTGNGVDLDEQSSNSVLHKMETVSCR